MKQETIICKCGCGKTRPRFDKQGKERRYIYRHFHHTLESRRKISESQKGRKLTEEQRRKISLSNMGRAPTNKGIAHSEATKKKISESLKGKPKPWNSRPPWNKGKRYHIQVKKHGID